MVLATKERIIARRQVSTRRYILSTHPVLYISMTRDGSGVSNQFLSDDGYGFLCTVAGALWTPQGRSFSGSTWINAGQSTTLEPGTGNFGIEVWGKTNTVAGGVARIVSKQSAAWYFLRRSTATWTMDWKDSVANALTVTSTANTAVVDKWTHLFAVRDGINGYLYIDGVLNASGSTVGLGNINPGAVNVYIGTYDEVPSETFSGLIGEIRIYNRTLTALEIQQNYLATKWRYK